MKIRQDETLCLLLFSMAKYCLIDTPRFKVKHLEYGDYRNYLDVLSTEEYHKELKYSGFMDRFRQIMKMISDIKK